MPNKEKYTLDFYLKCSISLLYEYIATSTGLGEWFADNVKEKGDDFYFEWDGDEEMATIIKYKEESLIRFRWEEDEDTKYYWQMEVALDNITNDLSLTITDFAEPDEVEEAKLYWTNKVDDLKKKLGAF